MTKEELLENFRNAKSPGMASDRDELRRLEKQAFETVIAPHLIFPRSLKDDPPKHGRVILFRIGSKGNPYIGEVDLDTCDLSYEIEQGGWIYWIPFPEVPFNKDEQEFEIYWKKQGCSDAATTCRTEGLKKYSKQVWLDARKA